MAVYLRNEHKTKGNQMKKLNTKGFAHIAALAIVVVSVAAFGTYMLVTSHAATCKAYTWRAGQSGTCVKYIQQLVNWQNRYNSYSAGPVVVDGSFGPKTKAAVIADQKQFGLTADGVVGPKTWNVICSPQMGPGIPPTFPLAAARAAGCNI